jgi:adenylylsulfate kinase
MIPGNTIWCTGLPCSGKTTIADYILTHIKDKYTNNIIRLDGDDVRKTLCSDLGFSDVDRLENIRRIAHICNILNKQGISVVASFISPTSECQQIVRDLIQNVQLVYISTPVSVCEERDIKGMYNLARNNTIKSFTGVSAPYHIPCACIDIDATNKLSCTITRYSDKFDSIFAYYENIGAFI